MSKVETPMGASLVVSSGVAGFRCYGAAKQLWDFQGTEAIIAGPYATGKTTAWLHKVNAVACKYPNARILLVRKTYRSLIESACVTLERNVFHAEPDTPGFPVHKGGGANPSKYTYPNGSEIVLGGLDKPGKLLSSEWDMVGVLQAEELTVEEWEALLGRTTGRAGNVKYPQVIGDCNPGPPTHWILKRDTLALFHSRHEDNPSLYDQERREWKPRGLQELAALSKLTGVRKLRGRDGKWVAAEGTVYEIFSRDVHLVDRFKVPPDWPRLWAVDFGFTNPFVWQQWIQDPDGRLYLEHEIYQTRLLVEDAARKILAITEGQPQPKVIVCDHDAEGRATLEKYLQMGTVAAVKAVLPGIEAVTKRLQEAGDGKPRLMFMRDALVEQDAGLAASYSPTTTYEEFEVYSWPKGGSGAALKEAPLKEKDHGADTTRYMVAWVDGINELGGASPPDERQGRDYWPVETIVGPSRDLDW